MQQRLKPAAVPSQFSWTKLPSPAQQKRQHRMTARCSKRQKLEETAQENLEADFLQPVECPEVIVETEQSEFTAERIDKYIPVFHDIANVLC